MSRQVWLGSLTLCNHVVQILLTAQNKAMSIEKVKADDVTKLVATAKPAVMCLATHPCTRLHAHSNNHWAQHTVMR